MCATALFSCNQKQEMPKCVQSQVPFDYYSSGRTNIPINTLNFWTYVDSVFDPQTGAFVSTSTSLITISDVSQINGLTYFEFNQLLPPMTVIGDSLFSVSITGDIYANDCYTLNKIFYPISDTVKSGQAGKTAYFDTTTVKTPAGNFSGNMVFIDGGYVKYVFHPGIGLIRNAFYLGNGILRRSLTLKDYSVK